VLPEEKLKHRKKKREPQANKPPCCPAKCTRKEEETEHQRRKKGKKKTVSPDAGVLLYRKKKKENRRTSETETQEVKDAVFREGGGKLHLHLKQPQQQNYKNGRWSIPTMFVVQIKKKKEQTNKTSRG
jgi:hypothetical protein